MYETDDDKLDSPTLQPNEEQLNALGEETEIMDETDEVDVDLHEGACALLLSYFSPQRYRDRIKFVPKGNILDEATDLEISDEALRNIGAELKEAYDSDKDSMNEWNDLVELGLKLVEQDGNPRNEPWDGAANFKSPLLQESAVEFGDRVATELLRKEDLVKIKTYGKPTPDKEMISERVATYLNYQLDETMEEWRDEQEKLIYCLPYAGTAFKDTYFDPMLGRTVSDLIMYPNFVVDRYCHSLSRLRRFSKTFELTASEIESRMRSRHWRRVELREEDADNDAKLDKYGVFIEMKGYYDLDGDGYQEPYTFVIHESSSQIVRIIPRFDPHKVTVRLKDSDDTPETTLATIFDDHEAAKAGGDVTTRPFSDYEVMRIQAKQSLTMYEFMRDPEGGLLGFGYCHLLAGITQAINATTNQLVDAGTLANLQGGWIAKGFRAKMGDMRIRPGSFNQTGLSASELKDGIMPFPFKEPSGTLLNLRQMMKDEGKSFANSVDLKGALSAQAPAATTLAMVQEQEGGMGAILLRIYRAMTSEFKKIFILENEYAEEEYYRMVVEDPQANMYADFDLRISKICPNANPAFASAMQRMQQAQAAMSQVQILMQIPGINVRPIITEFYKSLEVWYADEVAPQKPPQEMLQELLMQNPDLPAEQIMQILLTASPVFQKLIANEQQRAAMMDQIQQRAAQLAEEEKLADIEKTKSETAKNLKLATKAESDSVLNMSKSMREEVLSAKDGMLPPSAEIVIEG